MGRIMGRNKGRNCRRNIGRNYRRNIGRNIEMGEIGRSKGML